MPLQALMNGLGKCNLLTRREKEVLTYAHTGMTKNAIAGQLFISSGTVKKHFDNIFKKLQVGNKIEAINKVKAL